MMIIYTEEAAIKKYTAEIERIVKQNTSADYTWQGLLMCFLQEARPSAPTSTFRETPKEIRHNEAR